SAWQAERERVRSAGSQPMLRVMTATERASSSTEDTEVELQDAALAGTRPHGLRFGTLVHSVLAAVDLAADRAGVAATAALQGRGVGATADEIAAGTEVGTHALAHPLLRGASGGAVCRRETAITSRLPDGTVVEGVVDAAFDGDDGWTVIDFKTDV